MGEPRVVMLIAGIVAVAILLAGVVILARSVKRRRSTRLRSRFGPEYDHVLKERGDVARAEAALEEREQRARKIIVRPLSREEHERFAQGWREAQAHFVDDPGRAVEEADLLVEKLMGERGYPVGNFETQAEDISVDHPLVVQYYRLAHEIAARSRSGQASTEDLREAIVHYRKLYDELLARRITGRNPGETMSDEVKNNTSFQAEIRSEEFGRTQATTPSLPVGPEAEPSSFRQERSVMDGVDTGMTAGGEFAERSQSEAAVVLFDQNSAQSFRSRWNEIQAAFVDEPRVAVARAEQLVAESIGQLSESFTAGRQKLEDELDRGSNESTETLRLVFQRYRSYFNRLMSI
jgi:hypothetical protein